MQVATLRDPASARLGESLYTFLPRSVVGNLRDGVVMELDRLRARQLPFFCLHNRCAAVFVAETRCGREAAAPSQKPCTDFCAGHDVQRPKPQGRSRASRHYCVPEGVMGCSQASQQ